MFQTNIGYVSSYKYLKVHLTLSFNVARSELRKKALKSYYELRNYFISLNPVIEPVYMYSTPH